jgi:hypothetical protein
MPCMDGEKHSAMNLSPSLRLAVAAEGPAGPLLTVERIVGRAAAGEFWRVLADVAVSAVITKRAQGVLLTHQPLKKYHLHGTWCCQVVLVCVW